MKVVHVVRQFLPSIGGLERAVLGLSRALQDQFAIQVGIVTLDRIFQNRQEKLAHSERVEDLEVVRIPFIGSRRYPIAPTVLQHLQWADVIHVHAIDFFFDYLAATRLIHRKPMIATTHGGFFHTQFAARLKQTYFHSITRLSSKAYARICASSHSDADIFKRIAADRTVTVENGVDVERMADVASPLPLPALICFGRFSANKRIPLLFPILRALRMKSPGWRLIVAGAEDDVTLEQLKKAATFADIAETVEFVTSPTSEELIKLVQRSTYFISASAHEGFGIAAVEAMGAGLIPILSAIPSFRRFISAADSGVLIDPENAQSAANAILAFHNTLAPRFANERRRLMSAAHQYDWRNTAERYVEQYRFALEAAKRPSQVPDNA